MRTEAELQIYMYVLKNIVIHLDNTTKQIRHFIQHLNGVGCWVVQIKII